jgi:hypothetical protein
MNEFGRQVGIIPKSVTRNKGMPGTVKGPLPEHHEDHQENTSKKYVVVSIPLQQSHRGTKILFLSGNIDQL